ncbi:MAG: cobalamin biosynthesis protein CobQ, partial [Microcystaceae cyanobacterium]
MEIRIGWLYPTLMSTYGDRGNVICLQRRAQWRGIETQIVPLDQQTEAATFQQVDVIVGGGAQDRQQEIVMRDLQGG